jgi:hypothetical protein
VDSQIGAIGIGKRWFQVGFDREQCPPEAARDGLYLLEQSYHLDPSIWREKSVHASSP